MDMTASPNSHRECVRVTEMLGRIGDRWTLPVAVTLMEGPVRFNQIRRLIAGISQQMLTRTLRGLERDGLVVRTVYPTVPPQVDYALTPLGQSLAEEAMRLGSWVQRHLSVIDENRALFDSKLV
ncbi:helix-turn-helix transcriptional regulator [Sphingobium sp. BYY-5]|uniref:winged helix-turn-helix transcriptional regulator n=1 Tax=Sphingobium sp. BYY-5 TaxID=2926400 RepID=UPI001FA71132|nr:helix-turn-helix domain-containing protein [Sphingobium sp. BYY-5]MCI4591768.1 helix-turn-helix transcriptional regulator [Sphingobium sp. BYY-5]